MTKLREELVNWFLEHLEPLLEVPVLYVYAKMRREERKQDSYDYADQVLAIVREHSADPGESKEGE